MTDPLPQDGGTSPSSELSDPKKIGFIEKTWGNLSRIGPPIAAIIVIGGSAVGIYAYMSGEFSDIRNEIHAESVDIREKLHEQGTEVRSTVNETKNKVDVLEQKIVGMGDKLDLLIRLRSTLYPPPGHVARHDVTPQDYPNRR